MINKTFVIGVALLFLTLASLSLAQTHPCDQPPPATTTIGSGAPHKASWCSAQGDKIEALLANIDGVPYDLLPVTAKTGPSATGKILYESPLFIQVPRGAHILTLATYNKSTVTGALQLGAVSAPFPFSAVDDTPVPTAPEIKGVSRT